MAPLLRIGLPAALYLALFTAVSTASPLPAGAPVPSVFTLAPLYTPGPPPSSSYADEALAQINTLSHIIRDSYIIVLQDHLEPHHVEAHHAQVAALHSSDASMRALQSADDATLDVPALEGVVHKYSIGKKARSGKKALVGYAGKFSESSVDAIRAMEGVKYVERDSVVYASEIERGAPWGLARISHRAPLSFGTFNKYEFDGNGGEGVDAYVIDTGVNTAHEEFEGRAKWGKTIPKDPDQDLNGHGSHVAGTIASAKYGVAKKATIIAVKVLGAGGSGTMSDVVMGVSWAADAASDAAEAAAQGNNKGHKGSVANMSLGGGKSQALDDAVDAAVDDGLHFAVAAGNDNKDACAYSPASSVNAITVGASAISDERAYFSNHGKCVDIFAPGLNILSTWNTGKTSTNTISGTSMASPHVAGLAAYFLSLYPTSFQPTEIELVDEDLTFLQRSAQFVFGTSADEFANKARQGLALAPIPKLLTPKALKSAMIKVGSKGLLTDMPAGTPNILIFNNFTSSALVDILREVSLEQ